MSLYNFNECYYFSVKGIKLIHVSKRAPVYNGLD